MQLVTRILVLSNIFSIVVFVATLWYFGLFSKAYQRFFVEKRIPILKSEFELNRHYQGFRELHKTYETADAKALIIGDSLTSDVSWSELMDMAVYGRGIPGDTSDGVLNRIVDYATAGPDRLIIWIGTNDIHQGVPSAKVCQNVLQSVDKLEATGKRVAVMNVPPVCRWIDEADQRIERSTKLNRQLQASTNGRKVVVLDLANALSDEKGYLRYEFSRDGIHLNGQGYQIVKSIIREFLQE